MEWRGGGLEVEGWSGGEEGRRGGGVRWKYGGEGRRGKVEIWRRGEEG